MDLDAEKLINDEREAFKQAEILKAAGGLTSQQSEAQGVNVADPSGGGGGIIGVGQAPVPGEQGFSAPQTPATGPQEPDVADQLQQLLGGI